MENQNTKKDYTQKILSRFLGDINETAVSEISAINELVCFFNLCFTERNNFYLTDFNKKKLREVGEFYNQIKSNILSDTEFSDSLFLLSGIDDNKIKLLRFVVKSYISNYDELSKTVHNLVDKNLMIISLGIINRK